MTTHPRGVLLDLDGTLVDSVYAHVRAWSRSLLEFGHEVSDVAIHAAIGLGSDRLVPHLIGHVDHADELADAHRHRFLEIASSLRATSGARALVDDLRRRSVPFAIATSAGGPEREALLGILGEEDLPTVDADTVERSKPAPELLLAGAEQIDRTPDAITLVGDAPWDAHAARLCGMDVIGVLTGGFSAACLREAGATRIVADPGELVGTL